MQIFHELIVLSLETICLQENSHYLDPSFIDILKNQDWQVVSRRFWPPNSIHRPSLLSPAIAILVHVSNCHWVALSRRIIKNTIVFLYADDLNNPRTEQEIRELITTSTPREFAPPDSIWIHCKTSTSTPDSNKCGPRTVLALAVMMSHPNPNEFILLL